MKNFDDMMEYVSGDSLEKGDFADLAEYKVTSGKIIFVRRKGEADEFEDGYQGEYFGSLKLDNGKWIGFMCRDGSVRLLPK